MSSHIFFRCPNASCSHAATLTLEEFRELGAPFCPDHQLKMISKQTEEEGAVKAVGMIMTGVTHLVAGAMSYFPRRKGEGDE